MIECLAGIELAVSHRFDVRERRGRLEVRGVIFRYHAFIRDRCDVLRYDNSHANLGYHRHEFDLRTGEETRVTAMSREEFPTLIEVVDEVERLVRAAGLV